MALAGYDRLLYVDPEQNLPKCVQGTVSPMSSQHSHINCALSKNNCEERLMGSNTPGFTYELIRLKKIRELAQPSSCKFPDSECFIQIWLPGIEKKK